MTADLLPGLLRFVRVRVVEHVATRHQTHARRELVIEPQPRHVCTTRAGELDVEAGIGRVEGLRSRLALVLVVGEVMQPVPENGPAVGGAELLIRVRQDVPREEVGCVEGIVAEVAGERS